MVNNFGLTAFAKDQSIDICTDTDKTHYYQLFYQKWIISSPFTSLMSIASNLVPFN